MNTIEPEGWTRPKEVVTTIKTENNAGTHWPVHLEHNGKKYPIPKEGLRLHINGGATRIAGIPVNVQKGVANIFQHDAWTGRLKRIEPISSDNTLLPHLELSPES